MSDGAWKELWKLFDELRELPRAQRSSRLEALSPEKAARLAELLARHDETAGLLDRGLGLRAVATREGRTIGPYEIVGSLGKGGMGVVFDARQREPVERRVALKLVRGELAHPGAAARFEAERRAIARMDHPSIARLYDAGMTPDGELYFAMERVDGEPITRYCEGNALDLRARLELFIGVCRGVQHAHERGIIHRDLKPSNVLVAEHDGRPEPKIIDFGIARAVGVDGESEPGVTRAGQLVGTPEYMSPEQSSGNADTRSDVYSLAVLLYELLTGSLPHDPETLRRAGIDGLRRLLIDTEPPAPSRKAGSAPVAARLRGDLDWIVLKGLAAEPERRYRSPADLADDIERHLAHLPVEARPPSAAYRLAKLVRRRRVAVAIAAVVTVASLVAIGGVVVGLVRARAAQHKAEVMQRFLSDTFIGVTPQKARGRDTELLEEILEEAADRVESELDAEPQAAGELHFLLAQTYRALGRTAASEHHAGRAIELLTATVGEQASQTLAARDLQALALWNSGRTAEAIEAHRSIYAARRRTLGDEHPETLGSLNNLAIAVKNSGDLKGAVELYRRCLEARTRVHGPDDRSTRITTSNLARALQDLGEHEEAVRLMRELVDRERALLGDDDPDALHSIDILGGVLGSAGRFDEAERLHREALAGMRRVFGERHPTTNGSAFNLGKLLIRAGRHEEAEALLFEVETIVAADLGERHRATWLTRQNLADAICRQSARESEALRRFADVARTLAERDSPQDSEWAMMSVLHAECLHRAGRRSEASELAARVRPLLVDSFGEEHAWIERLDALDPGASPR